MGTNHEKDSGKKSRYITYLFKKEERNWKEKRERFRGGERVGKKEENRV